ncbi:hypothetical protein OXYTRIMIC_196 [Oxytricha trifallax]|uniref:Uncharacterized protein n=1 Tax=Oxytricha trifallax TaxID=1172189 RepID=A0A073I051_9SPIT|nr:hypothetical protein OXYTRIMIC_196 [Oxytricha trifallax]
MNQNKNEVNQLIVRSIENILQNMKSEVDLAKANIDSLKEFNLKLFELRNQFQPNVIDEQIYQEANNQNIKIYKYDEKLKVYEETLELLEQLKQPQNE